MTMEHEIARQDATPITAMQDEAGHWFLQDAQSRYTSKELFISLEVATKAVDGNFFTWDETE